MSGSLFASHITLCPERILEKKMMLKEPGRQKWDRQNFWNVTEACCGIYSEPTRGFKSGNLWQFWMISRGSLFLHSRCPTVVCEVYALCRYCGAAKHNMSVDQTHTQKVKQTLFNLTIQDRTQNFKVVLFLKPRTLQKQTMNEIMYLLLVRFFQPPRMCQK